MRGFMHSAVVHCGCVVRVGVGDFVGKSTRAVWLHAGCGVWVVPRARGSVQAFLFFYRYSR